SGLGSSSASRTGSQNRGSNSAIGVAEPRSVKNRLASARSMGHLRIFLTRHKARLRVARASTRATNVAFAAFARASRIIVGNYLVFEFKCKFRPLQTGIRDDAKGLAIFSTQFPRRSSATVAVG